MTPGHYHLHVHPLSKGQGHNLFAAVAYRHAVSINPRTLVATPLAAAAYRHGDLTTDDRDQVHDYRGKRGVAWTGILAPDDAPSWVHDPLTLWREVDHAEHRSNARFAQEVTLALPAGVPLEVHKELLFRFARTHCLPLRMVVDMSIHEPPTHSGGDARNWHAHVLLTDRPITPTGFAAAKDRRYTHKALVHEFREGWTKIHNELMAERG